MLWYVKKRKLLTWSFKNAVSKHLSGHAKSYVLVHLQKHYKPTNLRKFLILKDIWPKVFKSGISKFCGRQPLKKHFFNAVFHKVYLAHSWILFPICMAGSKVKYRLDSIFFDYFCFQKKNMQIFVVQRSHLNECI